MLMEPFNNFSEAFIRVDSEIEDLKLVCRERKTLRKSVAEYMKDTIIPEPGYQPINFVDFNAFLNSSSFWSDLNTMNADKEQMPLLLDEIAKLQKDFESAVITASSSEYAVVITEPTAPFRISHVNESWVKLCEYTAEEVTGKTLTMIQGPATSKDALSCLKQQLEHVGAGEVSLINYTKSGHAFQNRLQFWPLHDNRSGAVTHFLGILNEVGDVSMAA